MENQNCKFKDCWLYEGKQVVYCFIKGKTIAPHICKICEACNKENNQPTKH